MGLDFCIVSDKALIKNNAGVAAEIALHLTKLQNKVSVSPGSSSDSSKKKSNPVCC